MYEMKPEYYIGIDMIDEEHKQLFKYADEAGKSLVPLPMTGTPMEIGRAHV